MPYIKQIDRKGFSELTAAIENSDLNCAGDLNFILTKTIHHYMKLFGETYGAYNEVIGALECAKLELYRRKIAKYEDKKIDENGDV